MPRASAYAVENSFKNGLVTEASGLNFPENACTETYNCVFHIDGSVDRRAGLDFEVNGDVKSLDADDKAITTFLWRDAAGDGDTYLLVKQLGTHLYFYDASTVDPLSAHPFTSYIDLSNFVPSTIPSDLGIHECQFCTGNGLLFVTHPLVDPFYVTYTAASASFAGTRISVKIRDFVGLEDTNAIDSRPTATVATLSVVHHYNLLNQGWTETNLATWDATQLYLPSDCDIMWRFKDAADVFGATTAIINGTEVTGNSPAPKGHFVLNPFSQDRSTVSSITNITTVTSSGQRPSTGAFFAGRLFMSGVNCVDYSAKIYFSQIVEKPAQYGLCHQVNDPTSETLFDLLPTDGGVIDVHEAGTIIKLQPIPGGLAIFATNGVWLITGSQGIGFTATDYTISKLSSIRTLTASSFIDIAGTICWWNLEGIYALSPGQNGGADIKSLTHEKLLSFFYDIPPSSKRYARGYFNSVSGLVQWLYRSSEPVDLTEAYQFDRVLNMNMFTGAFYPWSLDTTSVHVHGLVVVENLGGVVSLEEVVDQNEEVIVDENGNVVTVRLLIDSIVVPKFKYLVSYRDSLDQAQFTFAEERNTDYVDWGDYDNVGTDFSSYFITGYKIRGGGMRKSQPNYLNVFSRHDEDTQFYIQGLWDFATSGNTGLWSSQQLISSTANNRSYTYSRVKIRGNGVAFQYKVTSISGEPFSIIGWAEWDTGAQLP